MKKSIRILAVALVAVMLCLTLASCGKISGTYEPAATSGGLLGGIADALNTGVEYTFKGSKVIIETKVVGTTTTFEGKYSVKGEEITFTFEDEDAKSYNGTVSFEKLDNGNIKIGGVEYKKVEK